MQIYYTDPDPARCAANLPDQLTYKILTEVAQLMASFLWENGIEAPMKKINQGKSFRDWIEEAYENWCWLYVYGFSLNYEYRKSYSGHKDCNSWIKIKQMGIIGDNYRSIFTHSDPTEPPKVFKKGSFEDWPTRDIIKLGRDETHIAYQKYLNWKVNNWKREGKCFRLYSWTNRETPGFIKFD